MPAISVSGAGEKAARLEVQQPETAAAKAEPRHDLAARRAGLSGRYPNPGSGSVVSRSPKSTARRLPGTPR